MTVVGPEPKAGPATQEAFAAAWPHPMVIATVNQAENHDARP